MVDFEKRIRELDKQLDVLGILMEQVYPVKAKAFTWTPQQKMTMQILVMLAGLKSALSDLNTRLVVLESE